MRVVCMFDGSCLYGHDGAGAAVAYDSDGVELARRARYLPGPGPTVNIAEYVGLISSFELGRHLGATDLRVLGDSELIVYQFRGIFQCRNPKLKEMLYHAKRAASHLSCVPIVDVLPKAGPKHKRRYGNVEADALASECRRARRDLP